MSNEPVAFAAGWTPLFAEYFRLKRQQNAILAWQMGDWFEFYFGDAEQVSTILGIALGGRGTEPNGKPIPMCAVPADARFSVADDCLLVPLVPTDHYFGKIVQAGLTLAVARHVGPGASVDHGIVAIFHTGDFPCAASGDVITLVGQESQLKLVGDR